ncbi:hypothetical protein L226DRAFT_563847 [Lentinus tigrinus ALCF2SS1-7]|uniref:uncharacterized protein n=1 Tax=Lentinus tigrinus ALCF2SS1-7 TaxID=1328758 RepID=UPI0011661760|nr:hypothetical protein L226DRAFT_563847 [Lentinus tigrinus ALCF2SS1-7]
MSNSEIASSWYDSVIANQTATAATVFMFYDFLITTGREVEAFWRRPVTAASILFFANKYISILNHILVFVTPLPQNDKSCTQIVLAGFVVELAQYIPWGAFSAMRTLALSRSRILAAIIAALFSVPFIVNFYLFRYKMDGKVDPLFGCQMHQDIHVPHSVTLKYHFLADMFAILKRLVSLLLILNSLHITFTLLSIFGTGGSSNMTAFTEPVTTVLTSRFLLDIQEASRRPVAAMSTDASMSGAANSSTAPWSSFAGSLSTAVYFSFIPDSQSSSEGGDEGE